ncbi:hypothetical protein, partial [Klebsiella variicola]|uniref:hypothetical protein n=1 Tax=Klebsiella variicola TaxID=244366 RepID=UPI00272F9A57
SGSSLNNGNEIVNLEATNNVFNVAIIEDRSNQVATNPVPSQPFHEFKKPKLDTPTAPVTPPITFVLSVHEQGPGAGPTSAK